MEFVMLGPVSRRRLFLASLFAPLAPLPVTTNAGPWDRLQSWAQEQPGYAKARRLNTHEWNYGRHHLCGELGPAPHDIGQGDGNTRITLAEYRAALFNRNPS